MVKEKFLNSMSDSFDGGAQEIKLSSNERGFGCGDDSPIHEGGGGETFGVEIIEVIGFARRRRKVHAGKGFKRFSKDTSGDIWGLEYDTIHCVFVLQATSSYDRILRSSGAISALKVFINDVTCLWNVPHVGNRDLQSILRLNIAGNGWWVRHTIHDWVLALESTNSTGFGKVIGEPSAIPWDPA
jgi:hypothetical protein